MKAPTAKTKNQSVPELVEPKWKAPLKAFVAWTLCIVAAFSGVIVASAIELVAPLPLWLSLSLIFSPLIISLVVIRWESLGAFIRLVAAPVLVIVILINISYPEFALTVLIPGLALVLHRVWVSGNPQGQNFRFIDRWTALKNKVSRKS